MIYFGSLCISDDFKCQINGLKRVITCIILFYEDNTPFSLNIVKVKNAIRPLEGRFDWLNLWGVCEQMGIILIL